MPFSSQNGGGSIAPGSIVNADINASAAIAATKIADGSVTSAEFQYLSNVTSDIQTQFTNKQPLDSDLTALAAQSGTNTFPVRTGAGTISEVPYLSSTYTPTVTLIGGAGNTTPVYSTNIGRHTRIGNRVFVDVLLSGDGGTEGAGTGVLNVNLPITASASHPGEFFFIGYMENGATVSYLMGEIVSGSTTVELRYLTTLTTLATVQGAAQNNASRKIRLKFQYEV
jgi:hypothetical protein